MTIDEKVTWLKNRHNAVSIRNVIEYMGNNPKLINIYNNWISKNHNFADCNEGILLIELLYNITKNKSK